MARITRIFEKKKLLKVEEKSKINFIDRSIIKTRKNLPFEFKKMLKILGQYHHRNHVKPNPSKTRVCVFHLRNKQANRNIKAKWQEEFLEHCDTPTYLGVTLDRTLAQKNLCEKAQKKANTRNGIIRKLVGSKWGEDPDTLRISAMALCFSSAEYAYPEWRNSVKKWIQPQTRRIMTGC